jgi:hypothetical protein
MSKLCSRCHAVCRPKREVPWLEYCSRRCANIAYYLAHAEQIKANKRVERARINAAKAAQQGGRKC